jgi:hypothetical protein
VFSLQLYYTVFFYNREMNACSEMSLLRDSVQRFILVLALLSLLDLGFVFLFIDPSKQGPGSVDLNMGAVVLLRLRVT